MFTGREIHDLPRFSKSYNSDLPNVSKKKQKHTFKNLSKVRKMTRIFCLKLIKGTSNLVDFYFKELI